MTLGSPYIIGTNALYLSTIWRNDLASAEDVVRLNTEIDKSRFSHIIQDVSYNLTLPRSDYVNGSATKLLSIPAYKHFEVKGGHRFDLTPMGTSGQPKYLVRIEGTGPVATPVVSDIPAGSNYCDLGSESAMASQGLGRGDDVQLVTDKLFFNGSTVQLTLTGEVLVSVGETLTQASTGASGIVEASVISGSRSLITLKASGIFNTTNQLTGSVSGALGANSVPYYIAIPEAQGEIVQVTSLTSTGFYFYPPAQDTYLVASNLIARKLNMAKGIRFDGLNAAGPGEFDTNTEGDRMMHIIWAKDLRLDSCVSDHLDNGGFWLYSCWDGEAVNCKATTQPNPARSANKYGFALSNACQDFLVRSLTTIGMKHGGVFTESDIARGVTRRCFFDDGAHFGTSNYALAGHTNHENCGYRRNKINGCNAGVELGFLDALSEQNEIRFLPNANSGTGIGIADIALRATSKGDKVYQGRYGLRLNTTTFPIISGSTGPSKIVVSDFYAEAQSERGIEIAWNGSGDRFDVELNKIVTREMGKDGTSPGVDSAAPSVLIKGNASGNLGRIRLHDISAHSAAGNTSRSILVQFMDGCHATAISYGGGHTAPAYAAVIGGGQDTLLGIDADDAKVFA